MAEPTYAMRYPIKLNDNYTCQGIDADGESVVYGDLLGEGERVGFGDRDENVFVDAHVVRRSDGLWVEALSEDVGFPAASADPASATPEKTDGERVGGV